MNVNDILSIVQRLNKLPGMDAFFEFSGHVDDITVRVNYKADYDNHKHNTIYRKSLYLHRDDSQEALSKMYFELNVLNKFYREAA